MFTPLNTLFGEGDRQLGHEKEFVIYHLHHSLVENKYCTEKDDCIRTVRGRRIKIIKNSTFFIATEDLPVVRTIL